jgi:hypothetical protein
MGERDMSAEVERTAATLIASGSSPYDAACIRWAIAHCSPADPLLFARELIAEMLTVYDSTHGRSRPAPTTFVCFDDSCAVSSGGAGCVGDFGRGITLRHVESGRAWVLEIDGRPSGIFTSRMIAERAARTEATLRLLAAELGLSSFSQGHKGAGVAAE